MGAGLRRAAAAAEAAQPKVEPPPAPASLASFYSGWAGREPHGPRQRRRLDLSGDGGLAPTEQRGTLTSGFMLFVCPELRSAFTLFGVAPQVLASAPSPLPQEKAKQFSLVDRGLHSRKWDYTSTARATMEDSMNNVAITDPWGELEKADSAELSRVAREDLALRMQAKLVETPRAATEEEKRTRGGIHMSSVWTSLETEDEGIEESLKGTQDLGEYQRLSQMQDLSMQKLSKQLEHADGMAEAPRLFLRHTDRLNQEIHDPWTSLERKDREIEDRVRRNPELKMLQMGRRLVRSHGS